MNHNSTPSNNFSLFTDHSTHQDLKREAEPLARPGVTFGGHKLIIDNGSSIKCADCEMEMEMPDIFQQTSGFRQALYKLYVLGEFKEASCDPIDPLDELFENDDSPNTHPITGTNPQTVTPNTHWIDIGGDVYTSDRKRSDTYIDKGGQAYTIEDLYHKHGDDVLNALPPEQAQQLQPSVQGTNQLDTSINYAQGQPSVTIDGSKLSDQQEKTLREKARDFIK